MALSACLFAVVANGLNGATFLGFKALFHLVVILRLFVNVGKAAFLVAFEVVRRRFPAEIAVNALIVHVEFARGIYRIFVRFISHSQFSLKNCAKQFCEPQRKWQASFW
jgi:hypothetical protein